MGRKALCALLLVAMCCFGLEDASADLPDCTISNAECPSTGGVVSGHATDTAIHGVVGLSDNTSGVGVRGYATAESGPAHGVLGESDSISGAGVYGLASAVTGNNYGVYGGSNSATGTGVYGLASGSGINYGVQGVSNSITGTGVYGYASAGTGANYGVYGLSTSRAGVGVSGYASAARGKTIGVYGLSRSTSGRALYGYASAAAGITYGVYGYAVSPSGYAVYAQGRLHATGNFTATGTKSAVVKLSGGEGVKLYAEEGAENWFFDAGSAELKEGNATVEIDPTFAKTVNTNMDYLVFITPRGDCKGLYISRQGENSFEVKEIEGGKSSIGFNYRVMAKRKGFEGERLAKVPVEEMTALFSPESAEGSGNEKLASTRQERETGNIGD